MAKWQAAGCMKGIAGADGRATEADRQDTENGYAGQRNLRLGDLRQKERGSTMVVQHIVWPDEARPEIAELYYHAAVPVEYTERGVRFPVPGEISLGTYFNFFDARKWRRYTKIEKVLFRIRLDGGGSVRLMGSGDALVAEQGFSGRQEICFTVSGQMQDYYYLSLELTRPTVMEAGTIETDAPGKDVRLALVICTYNRKKELLGNIALLKKRNREAADGKRVLDYIYVVDNASNLSRETVEGQGISLIPNRNTGGAGGFTRGMKEAMGQGDVTHILLMDDDVVMEFEAFVRTKSLLGLIREEYQENFIGGAMLCMDVPYVLHAAGEGWADMHIENPYKGTDLRTMREAIRTSQEANLRRPHAAWWYCCIPRGHVEKDGYPLPFFLHCDDIEYSLRNGRTPLYLNGIAVWHEGFEGKRDSVTEYYDMRNGLITNALHGRGGSVLAAFRVLCERFYGTVSRYRYRDFALSAKAVEDFLKGPEWLCQVDAETLHHSLKGYGYAMEEVGHEMEGSFQKPLPQYKRKSPVLVAARYLLPALSAAALPIGAPPSAYAGKKRVLLVEEKSGKGFVVEKSWKETARCAGELVSCMWRLGSGYGEARERWRLWEDEQKCGG